jgi:hypothetical protein
MKASGEFRLANVSCRIPPKRTLTALGTVLGLVFLSLGAVSHAQTNVTPWQYLISQQKPNFAPGNTLPKLCSWDAQSFSTNTCVELAKDWDYCLPFDFEDLTVTSITNATGQLYCYLATNNPSVYKLSVIMNNDSLKPVPNGLYCTNSAGLFVDDTGTNFFTNMANAIYSPEPPDSYLAANASNSVWSLRVLLSNAPIAIILDDGEWGLREAPYDQNAWEQDPRWAGATNGISWPGTDGINIRYGSLQKGHILGYWTSAIKALLPNRELSIYYETDAERDRTLTSLTGTGSIWSGPNYGFCSDVMNTNTDLPSFQEYWTGISNQGACFLNGYKNYDLLSTHLNQVGFNFTIGYTNDYSSISGGWQVSTNLNYSLLADIPTYTGFIKCLYTAGSLGAATGYFTTLGPGAGSTNGYGTEFGGPGWDAAFPSNVPPHWLLQLMALSHVHALFSQLEKFLTGGDLISGPQSNIYSLDQPAYEFTNTAGYVNDRVLARKLRGKNQWIVTAWAADGITNNVTVTIPTIGNLTVTAVPSASVYQVTMTGTNVQQTLLDEYSFPAPPRNLRVVPN